MKILKNRQLKLYISLLLIFVINYSCTQMNKNKVNKICNTEYCEIGEFKNDKKEGVWKRYDFKDNLIQMASYSDGLLHGPIVSFYENGSIYTTGYYINDTINGNMSLYFEDGKLNISSNFLNGKKEGFNYLYDRNRNLKFKKFYLEGKKNGRQYEYDNKSKIIKIEFFREGIKIDTIIN